MDDKLRVYVSDFGLAKALPKDVDAATIVRLPRLSAKLMCQDGQNETDLSHCRLHLHTLQTVGTALPIPWMAPETMKYQKYSAITVDFFVESLLIRGAINAVTVLWSDFWRFLTDFWL